MDEERASHQKTNLPLLVPADAILLSLLSLFIAVLSCRAWSYLANTRPSQPLIYSCLASSKDVCFVVWDKQNQGRRWVTGRPIELKKTLPASSRSNKRSRYHCRRVDNTRTLRRNWRQEKRTQQDQAPNYRIISIRGVFWVTVFILFEWHYQKA